MCLAVLNEVVWRTVSTDTWVSFKVFAIMPLTMVFALAQIGLAAGAMSFRRTEAYRPPDIHCADAQHAK